MIRSAFSYTLSESGYACITAPNAADAMQIIEANLFKLDLLVTDIKMPGEIDGLHLAKSVRRLQPDAGVMLVSAFVDESVKAEAKENGFRVLEKPFRLPQLIAAVAEEIAKLHSGDGATRDAQGSVIPIGRARPSDRLS